MVAKKTRDLVGKFPRRGYAELREQMLAAAESISHNIAEGRTAARDTEFLRFLDIAARSASELSSQLELVKTYAIAPEREAFNLIGTVICTRRMIQSLQQKIRTGRARSITATK